MKVLLVDDHNLVRNGLASLLVSHSITVAGEASDGLGALEKTRQLKPDVILMDINMPHCNGLEATRLIKTEMPNTKIIILTVSEDEENLFEAIKSGAEGYLLKDIKSDEFLKLLNGVTKGEAAISPVMATKIIGEFKQQALGPGKRSSEDQLSDREKEVLELVSKGDLNKEIASALHITENTVKYHLRNIMDKLHLKNRAAVAAYAAAKRIKPISSPTEE
jgi:DNA-binding NarL/FixJ family response regulator